MPRMKYDAPQTMRLSREAINLLDDIADELGVNRKSAVEILLRFIRAVTEEEGAPSYTDLLISHKLPTDR